MTSSFKTPIARRRDDGLQLSYTFTHRIFTAKPYPVLAPNGSTIIVYGYDNGIRIVWRGGKSFLSSPRQKNSHDVSQTQNDSISQKNDDSIMIIDSDDDEPAPADFSAQDTIEYEYFEDRESEFDPSNPYESILRHVDIPFGTRVLGLAMPSLLPENARSLGYTVPPILTSSIVLSVVCADSKLRIVSLPLAPPHPSTTVSGSIVQTLALNATMSLIEIPKGVSMIFTKDNGDEDEDLLRSRSRQKISHEARQWNLLVATHAAEASGTLLVYRIPIEQAAGGSCILPARGAVPSPQKYNLPIPATSISFNPSPYPSTRNTHLLVSYNGYLKILACSVASTEGKSTSANEKPEHQGKWLITLYPGFNQSPGALGRRKTIIDAAWVLSGRAVMVLLSDGEWGVWDIEGAGPGAEPGPLVGQSSIHGVTGGSLTSYSISGRIIGSSQTYRSQSASSELSEQRGKFAPMTPASRRVREDTLFKGAQPLAAPSFDGEITVVQTNSSRAALPEESILIRHGNEIAIIPSLLSLWRNSVKASGTFDASNRSRVTPLRNINLFGERVNSIAHLPTPYRDSNGGIDSQQDYEILIAAEHRLIILGRELSDNPKQKTPALPEQHIAINAPSNTDNDQLMLSQGQLGVDGMDRVLTSMTGALHPNGFKSPIKRTRIFS